MKISEMRNKGIISSDELMNMELPIERVITDQEFNTHGEGDYRKRAVERLLHLKEPFSGEWNIDDALLDKVVQFKCPYDGEIIHWRSAGGNVETTTYKAICPKCGATVSITLDHDAISIDPPSQERVESEKRWKERIKQQMKEKKAAKKR